MSAFVETQTNCHRKRRGAGGRDWPFPPMISLDMAIHLHLKVLSWIGKVVIDEEVKRVRGELLANYWRISKISVLFKGSVCSLAPSSKRV